MVDIFVQMGAGLFISIASMNFTYLGRLPDDLCATAPILLRKMCMEPNDLLRSVGLFVSIGVLFAGIIAGSNAFVNERVVFWREAAAGMPALPYYLAKVVADFQRIIISAMLFTVSFLAFFVFQSSGAMIYFLIQVLFFGAFAMGKNSFVSCFCL